MVNVDLTSAIKESVISGLAKVGEENTPRNRMLVLQGMYTKLSIEGSGKDAPILIAIEDEMIRLTDMILG